MASRTSTSETVGDVSATQVATAIATAPTASRTDSALIAERMVVTPSPFHGNRLADLVLDRFAAQGVDVAGRSRVLDSWWRTEGPGRTRRGPSTSASERPGQG